MPAGVADAIAAEAERATPDETGGVLIGYWAKPYTEVVVTAMVGPGPEAVHGRGHFLPDHAYQEKEIARYYTESGRLHTYLGDWHSHMSPYSGLSRRDRRTAWRIGTHAEARVPVPVMGVASGPDDGWHLTFWRIIPRHWSFLFGPVSVTALNPRIY